MVQIDDCEFDQSSQWNVVQKPKSSKIINFGYNSSISSGQTIRLGPSKRTWINKKSFVPKADSKILWGNCNMTLTNNKFSALMNGQSSHSGSSLKRTWSQEESAYACKPAQRKFSSPKQSEVSLNPELSALILLKK